MGFLDWLGEFTQKVGGFGQPSGLIMDAAIASTEQANERRAKDFSDKATRAIEEQSARDRIMARGAGVGAGPGTTYRGSALGGAVTAGIETVTRPARKVATKALETYDAIQEPIKRAGTSAILFPGEYLRQGGDISDTFSGAWERSGEVSFGQALDLGQTGGYLPYGVSQHDYRVLTDEGFEEVLKEKKKSVLFNIRTGMVDATYTMATDPLIVAGKPIQAIRVARMLRPVKAGEDIPAAFEDPASTIHKRVSTLWSDKTKGWGANDFMVASDAIRRSDNPMANAAALAEANAIKDPATREEMMKLVLRVQLGDQLALAELRTKGAAVADMLESSARLVDDTEPLKHEQLTLLDEDFTPYDELPDVRALHEDRIAAIDDEATKALHEAIDHISFMDRDIFATARASVPRITRRGEARVAAEHGEIGKMFTFKRSPWSVPVVALNIAGKPIEALNRMRANGYVDLHAADSHKEVDSFLRDVREMTPEQRSGYLNEYVRETTEYGRQAVVQRIERRAIARAAEEKGITPETAQALYRTYMREKTRVWGSIQNRLYSAAPDPDDPAKTLDELTFVEDGVEYRLNTALGPDQLANIEPMVNMHQFYRVLDRHADRVKAAEDFVSSPNFKGDPRQFLTETLDLVNSGWKMSVLLRFPAYPVRNMIEGNARTFAKSHSAATLLWMEGARNVFSNLTKRGAPGAEAARLFEADVNQIDNLAERIEHIENAPDVVFPTEVTKAETLDQLTKQHAELTTRVERVRKARNAKQVYKEYGIDPKAPGKRTQMTEPVRLIDGTLMQGAGAGPEGLHRMELAATRGYGHRLATGMQRDTESAKDLLSSTGRRLEGYEKNRFEINWGAARRYRPNDAEYTQAWLHDINFQMRNNPIMGKVVDGWSDRRIASWLRRDPKGRDILRRMPQWRNRVEDLVRRNRGHVDWYLPDEGLRTTFKERRLNKNDLDDYVKNGGSPPAEVHGAELANHGAGPAEGHIRTVLARALGAISDMPENKLTRHPHYVMMHRQRAKQEARALIDDPNRAAVGKGSVLDAEDLDHIHRRAHEYALKSLRETIYDASRRSNAAHFLRFVSPFFASHQDSMTRWWNLTKESPDILGYFNQLAQMPIKAGVVVDDEGKIKEEGRVTPTDKLWLAVPGWLGGEISEKDYKGSQVELLGQSLHIPIGTFNVIMPGDPWWSPGTGPMMQIPLSWARTQKPGMEDALRWLDPYGPTRDLEAGVAGFMPAALRRALSLGRGMDDEQFARTAGTLHLQDIADWVQAGSPKGEKPNMDTAIDKTRAIYLLRMFNNGGNPFPLQFNSKHQFAIDAWNRLEQRMRDEDRDYDWVTEQFTENYPEALKILAQGTSRNNVGIAPTAEAMGAMGEVQPIINANQLAKPHLIAGVVGVNGQKGEFNEAAWEAQLGGRVTPGGPKMRERKEPHEIARDRLVSLGYDEYRRQLDMIDAMADDRGLLSWKDDPLLVETRRMAIEKIRGDNPDWYEEFKSLDLGSFEADITRLRDIVKHKQWRAMPERTDIPALKRYLQIRDQFQGMLDARRKAGEPFTMEAQANAHLRILYTMAVQKLANEDTQFSRNWYNGFLERDPMLGEEFIPPEEGS